MRSVDWLKIMVYHKYFRMTFLEAGKYDEALKSFNLKLEIKQMRQRINDLMDAKQKAPKISLRK